MSLTFDAEHHRYCLNGKFVPSVTGILKAVKLIDTQWMNDFGRFRGSVVHRCCELWDKGTLKESTVDPQALPYLDAWREFCAKTKFKPRTVEVPRYHNLGYAGTEDAENEEFDIDRKTGSLQPWHALQLAAYSQFHPRPHTRRRIAVQLTSAGKYIAKELKGTTDWAVFQSCLNLYNWKGTNGITNP